MTNLAGKTVLVTGGSRGIGAAISRSVGSMGGQVLVHYAFPVCPRGVIDLTRHRQVSIDSSWS
jgi:hypothetical protein